MSTCMAVVPGCKDCELQARHEDEHQCDDLCRITQGYLLDEEFHRLHHEPIRCGNCSFILDNRRGESLMVVRPCVMGACTEWACPQCDTTWSSAGEIGCRCQDSEDLSMDYQ